MKKENVNISKRMAYAPFIMMAFMVLVMSFSQFIYNYYEYTETVAFQEKAHKQFLSNTVEKSMVDEHLFVDRDYLIQKIEKRTIYGFLITFVVIALIMGYTYFVFRKMIHRNIEIQKALHDDKEKLETMTKQLNTANEHIKQQIYVDTLTNLGNRHALELDIGLQEEPKLILIDIDNFKDINEFYGTKVGDYILCDFAQELKIFAEENGITVYRSGADEFALLENAFLDLERYEDLASSLVVQFKGKMLDIPFLEEPIEINVAIGFCLESEDIFKKASLALEEAKKKEIDYICYFRKIENSILYANQIKWSAFIKEALKNGTVMPYYQPIFDTHGRIVKYECLARILNDKEEAIPPGLFLSVSKKVKKYTTLSKILIDKSFKEIVKSDKLLSINMLARDMTDSDISNYVIDKLKEYNVAKQVVFEILEDESIENIERVGIFIDRVKRMGSQIAIDDFGTGYSNFSYLLQLKPDYIKIDGSLIRHLDTDKNSLAIVSAIITFARKLGIKTIAEYVHSEQIYNICMELGIDEFQGFYLGEPSAKLI